MLAGVASWAADVIRPGVIPWNMCQMPYEFPYGEGVCSLLHLFSLYLHLSYLLCLLSCAWSSLASSACCCFVPWHPYHTADSGRAPSLLLMSVLGHKLIRSSWHKAGNGQQAILQTLSRGQMCAHLPTSTKRGCSPKEPDSVSHLGETFLSVAAGGSFAIGTFPHFVLSSHLGSFSTLALGVSNHLCPGGDWPCVNGPYVYLMAPVPFDYKVLPLLWKPPHPNSLHAANTAGLAKGISWGSPFLMVP